MILKGLFVWRNNFWILILSSLDRIPEGRIVQEQKDLISSIIESLIAENDADQIAKSKKQLQDLQKYYEDDSDISLKPLQWRKEYRPELN